MFPLHFVVLVVPSWFNYFPHLLGALGVLGGSMPKAC